MSYRFILERAARRALRQLPSDVQSRLLARLRELAENPRPRDARRLVGGVERLYRVRAGDYRIIYEVRDRDLLIVVVALGHRRDIYRQL